MNKVISVLLLLLFVLELPLFAGLDSDKAMYVGGTVTTIPQKAEGILYTNDPTVASFAWKDGHWSVPYSAITTIDYGQHAGRRVGMAIFVSPVTLLSKKRRHYLTLEYTDTTGVKQAAIFELGKDAIRTTLKILETRTGKKIEYEDDEARKAGNK